jgi:hypothetical protein
MPVKKVTLWNAWTKTIAVLSGVGMIVGGALFFVDQIDTRYARANELKQTKVVLADSLKQVNQSINQTNIRIQQHSLQDQAIYIKREMHEIRVKCQTNNAYQMPEDARKRYLDYQLDLEQINTQMKSLRGKQ